MRLFFTILAFAILAGPFAVTVAAEDTGTIYGHVKTKGHKEVLAKWLSLSIEKDEPAAESYGNSGGLPEGAIDYSNLSGIYVILTDTGYKGGRYHEVRVDSDGFWPAALAVAVGDKIRVENKTSNDITVYLAGDGDDDIQEFPVIEEGRSETIVVKLTGDLELGVDELEDEIMSVASGAGWRTKRLSSGDDYEFEDLKAGPYDVVFWFWRLGSIVRQVTLNPGQRLKVDEILSVDRIIK
jgi:hypothetical protein